jgi:hypothetical protein
MVTELLALFSAVMVVPLGMTPAPPEAVGSVMVQPRKKDRGNDEVKRTDDVAVVLVAAAILPDPLCGNDEFRLPEQTTSIA